MGENIDLTAFIGLNKTQNDFHKAKFSLLTFKPMCTLKEI